MTTVEELYAGGFPIYTLKRDEKRQELLSLLKYDRTQMIQDGVIGQSMHSMGLCWHYHPHAWSVKCGDMLTPMDVFADAELLRDAIARRNNLGGCVTQRDERQALRMYSGTQGVSGFRATAAAAVFDRYLPNSGGTVWDMSAGYGGRLLGALLCPRVQKYVATEPARLTYDGLCDMRDELTAMMREMRFRPPLVELHQLGSEDFKPEPDSFDLCFTSPPYGPGHERYSDEETQSYKRYPTNEQWMNGYIRRTLENCRRGLKPDGWLVVNLAPVPSYPRLVGDFLSLAADLGWCRKETLKLALSKMPGTKHLTSETHKREPCFCFQIGEDGHQPKVLKGDLTKQDGVMGQQDGDDADDDATVSNAPPAQQELVIIEPVAESIGLPGCIFIYAPEGKAGEYAPLAANPYRGCGHGCSYCYVPLMLKMKRPEFDAGAKARPDFLKHLAKDARKYKAAGITEQVFFSFTSDVYSPFDRSLTRPSLQLIQEHGMGICVLTKGGTRALADIDLYRPDRDCFASTLTSLDDSFQKKWERNAASPDDRIAALKTFHEKGIFTWVSLEPTLDVESSLAIVEATHGFVDLYKIGRANYLGEYTRTTDWRDYTLRMVDLCQRLGVQHYIKRDLQQYLPVGYNNPMRVQQHF